MECDFASDIGSVVEADTYMPCHKTMFSVRERVSNRYLSTDLPSIFGRFLDQPSASHDPSDVTALHDYIQDEAQPTRIIQESSNGRKIVERGERRESNPKGQGFKPRLSLGITHRTRSSHKAYRELTLYLEIRNQISVYTDTDIFKLTCQKLSHDRGNAGPIVPALNSFPSSLGASGLL